MEPPRIDEPIRLRRGFFVLYALALLFFAWLLHPWSTDDHNMAVLGIILFPFLGSLILYSVGLFSWAIIRDFRKQRRAFFIFAIALIGILLAYGIASWRERPISSAVSYAVVFVAISLLRYLSKRLTNQSLEPTLASVTPPAGREPRPR